MVKIVLSGISPVKLVVCIQPEDAEVADKVASEPCTVVAKARNVTQTSSTKKVNIIIPCIIFVFTD